MLNEKGQSMVGVLVALGISGIVMMLIADLNVVMIKNNATAQANSDILGYVNQLRVHLANESLVTPMLKGNAITGPVTLKDPLEGSILAKSGYKQQPNDAWNVSSVSFENVVATDVKGIFKLTVALNINKDQTRVIGSAFSHRIVGDVYCFVESGIISNCGKIPPVVEKVPEEVSDDPDHFKRGCSAIGGEMSDGRCTLRSTKDQPCND